MTERKLKKIEPFVEPEFGRNKKSGSNGGNPSDDEPWPEIKPISTDTVRVKPFHRDLFPDPIAEWVMDHAKRMGCPPDYFGIPTLISLGSVIGIQCRIYPKVFGDWCEVCNLWGFVGGPPGSKKSPAMDIAMRSLHYVERKYSDINEAEQKEYQKQYRKYKLLYKSYEIEFKKNPNLEEPEMPEEPAERHIVTSDFTIPALAKILIDNPGVCIHRDEIIGLWKFVDSRGNENAREFLKQSHNGKGTYITNRKGEGTRIISNLCTSIVGCINDDLIAEYIKTALTKMDDGWVQRYQVSAIPDDIDYGNEEDRKPRVDQSIIDKIFIKLAQIHGSIPFGENPKFHFDEKAQSLFNEFQIRLRDKVRNENLSPALQNHFSKYEGLVPKLSLIFHVLDWAIRSPKKNPKEASPVTLDALERALMWINYLEPHAHRIYATSSSPEMKASLTLLRMLKNKKLEDGMTLREIQQRKWAGLGDHEVINNTLRYFEERGYIRIRNEGKKQNVVRVSPQV